MFVSRSTVPPLTLPARIWPTPPPCCCPPLWCCATWTWWSMPTASSAPASTPSAPASAPVTWAATPSAPSSPRPSVIVSNLHKERGIWYLTCKKKRTFRLKRPKNFDIRSPIYRGCITFYFLRLENSTPFCFKRRHRFRLYWSWSKETFLLIYLTL